MSQIDPSLVLLLRARREMYSRSASVLPRLHRRLHRAAMEKASLRQALRRRVAEAFDRLFWTEGARLRAALAVLALAAFGAAAWLAVSLPQGGAPVLAQQQGQPPRALPVHATPAAPELFVLAGVPASADEIVSF